MPPIDKNSMRNKKIDIHSQSVSTPDTDVKRTGVDSQIGFEKKGTKKGSRLYQTSFPTLVTARWILDSLMLTSGTEKHHIFHILIIVTIKQLILFVVICYNHEKLRIARWYNKDNSFLSSVIIAS